MSAPPPQPPTFYPPAYASSSALGAAGWGHDGSHGRGRSGSIYVESGGADNDSGAADTYSDSPAYEGSMPPEQGSSRDNYADGDGDGDGGPGDKKKATRGARACLFCRKQKMKCVGGEDGPPCTRCKKGGKECIFEESQRGKRSNRKTDAMAKSLKSMEAKLESVLASISNPGLLAGSGGLVTDVSQQLPPAPLNSGPGGAEGRGDMHAGVDPSVVANALEHFRNSGSVSGAGGSAGRPAPARNDSESAITRREPIVLPSIAHTEGVRFDIGGGVGPHSEIGPSRTGGHPLHTYAPHPLTPGGTNPALTPGGTTAGANLALPAHGAHQHAHAHHHVHFPAFPPGSSRSPAAGSNTSKSSPLEWSGVKDPNAADGSPRLHSLPDNTLNPLGLLAEASLRNTRKRPVDLTEEYDVTTDDMDGRGAGGAGKGKGKGKGKGNKGKEKEGEGEGAAADDGEEGPDKKKRKKELGMANRNYFAPGPMNILPLRRIVIEQRMPPALLEEKILSVEEVVELFQLFFEHCSRHCPFLDPEIHTPAATGSRSPFLFTCICTVAARYYTKRTDDLYRKCLRIAKRVAFDVMSKGYKSTEICQGFLLLCNWNQPAERFEEERTYQFSGLAIRMATDLNLHRKTIAQLPPDVSDETRVLYERELLNRERAWMYCFISDRSVSTQMGKPHAISKEDFLVRNATNWWNQSGSLPSDSGLSAMVEMLRIVGRMIDVLYSDTRSVSGLNAHLDYPMLIRAFLQQLDQWRQDWSNPTFQHTDQDEKSLRTRAVTRDFYHSYYRLFLLSFAVQHALDDPSSSIDLPSYCVLCFEAAERMIIILRDYLGPEGILRYAIDSTFVYASYAATFLLKLVSPTFASFIDEQTAMRLVRETADVLEAAAVDEQHTPALYASFLRTLIDNKLNGPRTAANSRAPTRPGSPNPSGAQGGIYVNNLAMANGGGGPSGASVANGLESYLKSRAPSLGPEFAGLPGANMNGGEFGVGSLGFPAELGGAMLGGEFGAMGGADGGFDSLMADDILSANGFWSSMLMPGFGGTSMGLSGGSGTILGNPHDPFSVTPFHSRPPSPSGGARASVSGAGGGYDFPLLASTPAAAPAPPAPPAPAPAAATDTHIGDPAATTAHEAPAQAGDAGRASDLAPQGGAAEPMAEEGSDAPAEASA